MAIFSMADLPEATRKGLRKIYEEDNRERNVSALTLEGMGWEIEGAGIPDPNYAQPYGGAEMDRQGQMVFGVSSLDYDTVEVYLHFHKDDHNETIDFFDGTNETDDWGGATGLADVVEHALGALHCE